MGDDGNSFFIEVPAFSNFEGVTDIDNYRPLPGDWALVTGDIVDSTGAIAAGNYKSVNMSGASIISAVLNGVGNQDLPFVFGGDGALVAVPAGAVEKARDAMAAVRTWVHEEMGLEMRAAIVPIGDIRAAGLDVRVARFRVSDHASYAMFAGGGASWAEARMKEGLFSVDPAPAGVRPDLTGLSCRWNPVPSRHGEIVSVIAVPEEGSDASAFAGVIADIVAIVAGQERSGHPLPQGGPVLGPLTEKSLEWEAKAAAPRRLRLLRKAFIRLQYVAMWLANNVRLTNAVFSFEDYRRDIAANSDFRKFDDGLKMTIDVNAESLRKIEARLEEAASAHICRYGLHRQASALITCFVLTPLKRDHMHFIDGAAGGYALAAARLKGKVPALVAGATP